MSRHFRAYLLPTALLLAIFPFAHLQADAGDSCRASLSLDGQLRNGANPGDVAKACLTAAEANKDPVSQYMAGLIYEYGIGESKDSMKAKNRYRDAAYKGYAQAQFAMGRMFEESQAFDWALAWYARAATNKNQAAQAAFVRLKAAEPGDMWQAAMNAISIDDSQGGIGDIAGSGSGIVVSDNIVITNEHVVEHCDRMSIAPGIPATVVAKNAELDLAVLKTSFRTGGVAQFADQADIAFEDKLYTGGYPAANEDADPDFAMTEGQRSKRDIGEESEKSWLLSNQVNPGNSGGPLLDSSGLVKGVVFASIPVTGIVKKTAPKRGHEGMAIRLDTIKGFLKQNGIAYQTASVGPVKSAGDMEPHVADITVLVECFAR